MIQKPNKWKKIKNKLKEKIKWGSECKRKKEYVKKREKNNQIKERKKERKGFECQYFRIGHVIN